MNAKITLEIDELLRLTEEMISFASKGDWEAVEASEAQRVKAIGLYSSLTALQDSSNNELADKLKQLLEKNAEIVALAIAEKNRLADEMRRSKQLEKADKTYRDVDAGP